MGAGARRAVLRLLGILFILAALYCMLAAGVILVLALTDPSGFITNAGAVILVLVLLASGLALAFLGIRNIRTTAKDSRRNGATPH